MRLTNSVNEEGWDVCCDTDVHHAWKVINLEILKLKSVAF